MIQKRSGTKFIKECSHPNCYLVKVDEQIYSVECDSKGVPQTVCNLSELDKQNGKKATQKKI